MYFKVKKIFFNFLFNFNLVNLILLQSAFFKTVLYKKNSHEGVLTLSTLKWPFKTLI